MWATVATAIVPLPNSRTATDPEYETPERLDARDILPPDLLKGQHYTVLDEVIPFRLTLRFDITSPFGQFEAYGVDMLETRIREIQAIAAMEEQVDQLQGVVEGAAHAILSPFKFVVDLFTDPVETVASVPKGIWRMMTRVGEMASGERGEFEDVESEELIGFSLVKRRVADHFGVDVYSSNPVLQERLNTLSWAGFAGDTAVRLATIPIGGPATAVLSGTSISTTIGELIRDAAPEDLRRLNRKKLEDMDIDEALIEKFLRHPWYSPRHETVLVQVLSEMDTVNNRHVFLDVALSAEFEEEALFFQRMAEMLLEYHRNVKPLSKIVAIEGRLLMGLTQDQRLVGMLPINYLPWRPELARAAEAVKNWEPAECHIKTIELWIAGKPTPHASHQLLNQGITVHEDAMARLILPPLPEQTDAATPILFPTTD